MPFIPRSAETAIRLGEALHRRLGDVPFRTLNRDQQALVTQGEANVASARAQLAQLLEKVQKGLAQA